MREIETRLQVINGMRTYIPANGNDYTCCSEDAATKDLRLGIVVFSVWLLGVAYLLAGA